MSKHNPLRRAAASGSKPANEDQKKILRNLLRIKKVVGRRSHYSDQMREFWREAGFPDDITHSEAAGLIEILLRNNASSAYHLARKVVEDLHQGRWVGEKYSSVIVLQDSCRGIYDRLLQTNSEFVADQPAQPQAAAESKDDLPF